MPRVYRGTSTDTAIPVDPPTPQRVYSYKNINLFGYLEGFGRIGDRRLLRRNLLAMPGLVDFVVAAQV